MTRYTTCMRSQIYSSNARKGPSIRKSETALLFHRRRNEFTRQTNSVLLKAEHASYFSEFVVFIACVLSAYSLSREHTGRCFCRFIYLFFSFRFHSLSRSAAGRGNEYLLVRSCVCVSFSLPPSLACLPPFYASPFLLFCPSRIPRPRQILSKPKPLSSSSWTPFFQRLLPSCPPRCSLDYSRERRRASGGLFACVCFSASFPPLYPPFCRESRYTRMKHTDAPVRREERFIISEKLR